MTTIGNANCKGASMLDQHNGLYDTQEVARSSRAWPTSIFCDPVTVGACRCYGVFRAARKGRFHPRFGGSAPHAAAGKRPSTWGEPVNNRSYEQKPDFWRFSDEAWGRFLGLILDREDATNDT